MRACMQEPYHAVVTDLEPRFTAAQARIKPVTGLGNDALLELYALYKQATAGDATGSRPGMLDLKGRAKFDAWARLHGASREDAMTRYIALVDRLAPPA
jgi:diazepam-binding inhibitor (GABA receptor modulator, acyl-CoA-binding protein)